MNEISEIRRLLDEWDQERRHRPYRTFDKSAALAWPGSYKERTCRCGRTFFARRYVCFCSQRCQLDDRNATRRERRVTRERDLVTCANPECGVAFQPIRSTARFCSDKCRQRMHRRREQTNE